MAEAEAQSPIVTLDADMTPRERIVAANVLARRQSLYGWIRGTAANITRGNGHIPSEAPVTIARWLRQHVTYVRECPGIELLQGIRQTLTYRVGDCDDLALAYVALACSIGVDAFFVGLAEDHAISDESSDKDWYFHALPFVPGHGLIDPTDDYRYSRRHTALRPSAQRLAGMWATYYDPIEGTWWDGPAAELAFDAATAPRS